MQTSQNTTPAPAPRLRLADLVAAYQQDADRIALRLSRANAAAAAHHAQATRVAQEARSEATALAQDAASWGLRVLETRRHGMVSLLVFSL